MSFKRILLAIVFIPLALGVAIIFFEIARAFYMQYPEQDFCSLDDEVFKTIVADVDEWIKEMSDRIIANDLAWGRVTFWVPSGRSYTASSYNQNSYQSYLFIVLKRSWNERYGFIGYIYSSLGIPILEDKYKVKYLADGIYCYQRKVGYD